MRAHAYSKKKKTRTRHCTSSSLPKSIAMFNVLAKVKY